MTILMQAPQRSPRLPPAASPCRVSRIDGSAAGRVRGHPRAPQIKSTKIRSSSLQWNAICCWTAVACLTQHQTKKNIKTESIFKQGFQSQITKKRWCIHPCQRQQVLVLKSVCVMIIVQIVTDFGRQIHPTYN